MDAFADHYDTVVRILRGPGLLLGSTAPDGKPNAMTIGWGTLGSVWRLPMWIVLVRPSRHTYACIEHSRAFTVNVPPTDRHGDCRVCGTQSGRDVDKFAACGLTARKAAAVDAPLIAECPIAYACRVVHHLDIRPDRLPDRVRSTYYRAEDFHRVYFGEVVEVRVDPDAGARLG